MLCAISPLAIKDDKYLKRAAVIGGGTGFTSGNDAFQLAAR
jgi:hypothetical protein